MPAIQFSGLATGIDSAALIDALIEARETTNNLRKNEIEQLESANTALDELNTMLIDLNGLIDQFRTVNGGGISKTTNSGDTDVATAVAGSDAINGSLSLTVNNLAKSATGSVENSTSYTAITDPFAANDGTLELDIGQGADLVELDVAITGGATTLEDVVNAINSDATVGARVSAAAVNVGTEASPEYKLLLTSRESGTAEGNLTISTSGTAGFIAEISSSVDQAASASFDIAGLGTITRDSNSVSDVIDGLTIQLVGAGTTEITIADDAESTADAMQEIIDKYNEIVNFINSNDTVERVEEGDQVDNIYGSLATQSVDNDFITSFRSELFSAESTNGTAVTSLSLLGFQTNRDGTLEFDREAFIDGANSDSLGTEEVLRDFADSASGVGGAIAQYTRFQGLIDVAEDSNNTKIENLNDAIERQNRANEQYREGLQKQFTRLEAISGGLQGQQQALSNILASL